MSFSLNKKFCPFRCIEEDFVDKYKVPTKELFYLLLVCAYPSGALHTGHLRYFIIGDATARWRRLLGFDVKLLFSWDSFGLPAEMAAIENGVLPRVWTESNISNMKKNMESLNLSVDWNMEFKTIDSAYIKQQQEIFIKMFEADLAYEKESYVNWDPVLKTVLADEQIDAQGRCWRSNALVEQKLLKQIFFRITKYEDELLNFSTINWPEHIKTAQKEWIGKSTGIIFKFKIYEYSDLSINENEKYIEVFTTLPHTIFGVTFIATHENRNIKSVLHPISKEIIPVFQADYVLPYGTGAVMGVPAHDERDALFANENNLPFKQVIFENNLINSDFLNDLSIEEATKILFKEYGEHTFYKLRDWCISRQRFWGCAIPLLNCHNCGIIPVQKEELPIIFPDIIDDNFFITNCWKCGKQCERYKDTMDTYVDSSWYQLYFNKQLNTIAPNLYIGIGGSDHAVSHLLYSRFMTKVLRDFGMINLNEPFPHLVTHGLILNNAYKGVISGKYYAPKDIVDGHVLEGNNGIMNEKVEVITNCKMSKSLKNGITIESSLEFGVNAVRLYILSDNPIIGDMTWNENALRGCYRFVNKIWTFVNKINMNSKENIMNDEVQTNISNHFFHLNKYISNLEFNLYVARLRMLFNYLEELEEQMNIKEVIKQWLVALFPICPSLSAKCFEILFNSNIQKEEWIHGTEKKESILVIQINGKKHSIIDLIEINEHNELKEINEIANKLNIRYKKYIYVVNKLINFVI